MSHWEQLGLDIAGAPASRRTDGSTSREAALLGGRSRHKAQVLAALCEYGPLIDEEIAQITGLHPGSASKRRLDLQRLGLVDHWHYAGEPQKGITSRGSSSWLWMPTIEGGRVHHEIEGNS